VIPIVEILRKIFQQLELERRRLCTYGMRPGVSNLRVFYYRHLSRAKEGLIFFERKDFRTSEENICVIRECRTEGQHPDYTSRNVSVGVRN